MKISRLLAFALTSFLLAGCATTTPVDSQARALCIQTFGTDAYLSVLWLPVGEVDRFFTVVLSNNSDQLKIASAMEAAKAKRVDLVVWTEPHGEATFAIERALRQWIPRNERLEKLNFLFVGEATDANRLRPEIEATGAKFYFHQR
jgi:hypothetical protein